MDIRQLRYFLCVCEYGSILQASQHVFLSQQALSRAMSSLEQELGLTLFRRTSRGLILTDSGKLLQELAQPVISSMDHLTDEISISSQVNNTHLKIGTTPALQFFINPPTLQSFLDEHPAAKISFEEHSFDECEDHVKSGELTAALVNGPVNDPNLVVFNLAFRQRIAIIPKDSPLAQKQVLSIQDLNDQRLVASINSRCYDSFRILCKNQGFEPNLYRVSDNSTVYELCSKQGYIGITIDFVLLLPQPNYPNLIALPIESSELSYPLDLIISAPQYKRKIIRSLVDHISKNVQKNCEATVSFPFHFF